MHGGHVDPVAAGLDRIGDLGRVVADIVVLVFPRQRMHAVRTQRDGGGGIGRRPPERPLEGDQTALDHCLIAQLDVIAWQPGVGAHGASLRGGDVPVDEHLVEDEAGDPVLLAVARQADTFAIVRGDVDGRARRQLARGVLDQLGGDG